MKHKLFILALAALAAACGSMPAAPTDEETPSLAAEVYGAIWHSERGEELLSPAYAEGLGTPNEEIQSEAVLVPFPDDGSGYVHGVFTLDIPDLEPVELSARVGLPEGTFGEARFEIFIQDGESFPLLAETMAAAGDPLRDLVADLTPFRGQSRMLILSVTPMGAVSPGGCLWAEPTLRNP